MSDEDHLSQESSTPGPAKLTKEQTIALLWKKGHLSYKLKPHQKQIYDKVWSVINGDIKSKSYVINCSRRFGKSFILVLVCIEFAIRFPKSQIRYAIPVAATYLDMLMPSINLILLDAPADLQIEHYKSEKRLTFGNGSMIKIAGTDNGNSMNLRGSASHLNIIDEAAFATDLRFLYRSILSPQTLTTKGKTIFSSTPPKNLDHDYVKFYDDHKELGLVSEYTIHDNTSLDKEQYDDAVRDCGGEDTEDFRREYLVQFIGESEIKIISEWNNQFVQEWKRDDFFPFYLKYASLDSGVRHFTVCLFGYYDYSAAKLIIEDEVVMNGTQMTTEKLSKKIKDKVAVLGYPKEFRKIADNNNLHLINDLSITYNLPFVPTTKTDLDAMVNKVKIMVGAGKIIVHPRCEQLKGCLEFGKWKNNEKIGKEFAVSKKFGHFDALAALIYLCRNLDVNTNPIPAMLGINKEQYMINPYANQESNVWDTIVGHK